MAFEEHAVREKACMHKALLSGVIVTLIYMIVLMGVAMAQGDTEAVAGIDLAELTDDEVITLAKQVNKEIVERKIQKTATVPAGTYIIGEDIPAGKYVYVCGAKDDDYYRRTVSITESRESDKVLAEYDVGGLKSHYIQSITLTLSDGNCLYSEAPFTLTTNPTILFE